MKCKDDKRVNKRVKILNRQLKEDVFGTRFWLRQVKKVRTDGIMFYMYELKDRLQPERDALIPTWFTAFEIVRFNTLDIEMNNFIVSSDFWANYRK